MEDKEAIAKEKLVGSTESAKSFNRALNQPSHYWVIRTELLIFGFHYILKDFEARLAVALNQITDMETKMLASKESVDGHVVLLTREKEQLSEQIKVNDVIFVYRCKSG